MAAVPMRRVWVTTGDLSHIVEACVELVPEMRPDVTIITREAAMAIFMAANATSVWSEPSKMPPDDGKVVRFDYNHAGDTAAAIALARDFLWAKKYGKFRPAELNAMKAGLPPLSIALVRVGELLGDPLSSLSTKALPIDGRVRA